MVMFTMHTSEQLRKDAQAIGIKDVISKSDTIGGHLFASLKYHLRSADPSLFPVEKRASESQRRPGYRSAEAAGYPKVFQSPACHPYLRSHSR
jgi:hypothetical protein